MTEVLMEEKVQEEQEPVTLVHYVPNVTNFDQLNALLISIGAVVVLTEDKALTDVNHNPELWRQLTEEELKG
jgi:hypothetical protein